MICVFGVDLRLELPELKCLQPYDFSHITG